ncbi:MAG: ATP synthase F0 subunit B [Proteobacteria bacterium]|nr:ATP synthase F0 subunit B [Pseudomonadota bacterium]
MKIPGIGRKRRFVKKGSTMLFVMVVLLFCITAGMALASSGGEGGTKGWVANDTYRVMNFAVLFIALFVVLRKPATQALDGRIKGIKDQLSDLEAKKKEAEKQLAAYNEKFAQLEQEAERLIDEYVRQGNEAKARILAEAESTAEKLEEQARRNIEHEFKKAKAKLQEEILEKALEKAEAIIKSKITAKDQDKLVDEYLEKVVA